MSNVVYFEGFGLISFIPAPPPHSAIFCAISLQICFFRNGLSITFFSNSEFLFYEMIHHMIVEEECLLFERCSNVSHVPTCAFTPYEIHAPLPTCCGIFILKFSSVPPQLSSLQKFVQFIQRRRFFAITIKISAILFPHFNTHPVTSRFPSFIKVDHIKSKTRICGQYISSIYTLEKLACLRIFSQGFFYLVGIYFFMHYCASPHFCSAAVPAQHLILHT